MPRRWSSALALLALTLGCAHVRPAKVPGETDVRVREVRILGAGDQPLSIPLGDFKNFLAQRAGGLIQTNRWYNPFRVAEDRRRVTAFWQNRGFFDVVVTEDPREFVTLDDGRREVTLTWRVAEGPRATIASLDFQGFPAGTEDAVRALVPFGPGDPVDLEKYRLRRWDMADVLQERGYAHAAVLSRAWVDRARHEVHWAYIADLGPETRVGSVKVVGAHRVDPQDILDRAGIAPGEPWNKRRKDGARLDLLDTGAFYNVVVSDGADIILNVGIPPPDSGGVVPDERIRDDGTLVPRDLPDALDVTLSVVESPRVRGRLEAGLDVDPARLDGYAGGEVVFPDLLGSLQHLSLDGRLGYGWLWRDTTDQPLGLYGAARITTTHVGALGRLWDLRLTAAYDDRLAGSGAAREVLAGPGVRATLAPGLFVDLAALYGFLQERGLSPLTPDQRAGVDLADAGDTVHALRLQASVVWDRRDDPVEARKGHLLALRVDAAPGAPLATHRWVTLSADARKLFPIGDALAVGLRASGAWVLAPGDEGVPLGARLFGGGAWGYRGFGRQALSPRLTSCDADGACGDVRVGGLSLFESSLELRWLPFVQQVGASLWTDVGGASASANPFEDGVGLAAGLGLRVRLWHIPMGLDVGYRILDRGAVVPGDTFAPYQFFFRVGEAF